MSEVAAIPPNGLVAASTFSGCGGSSLGYRMAGFQVRYANEFIEAARDTYAANQAEYTVLDGRDIRDVAGRDILDACGGSVDLLDGSPPCSDFSTAGKRDEGWGKVKRYSDSEQRVDDLFFEFTRLIREVKPKTFVAENVSGLVKGTAKGYFKMILASMKACGYRVEAKLLNASWLGVPQARQRIIFVGVREDLGFAPPFPKPFPYQYTVRDAIGDSGPRFDPETGQDLDFTPYAIYGPWKVLPVGGSPSGSYFNLVRVDPDRPAPTVAASHGSPGVASISHWEVPRKFSLVECRRISSFPDDFVLTGDYGQRWERIGRAVPPVMMKQIASAVAGELLAHG
jgi:DNA (cytosine-5)-methyltransferase 1